MASSSAESVKSLLVIAKMIPMCPRCGTNMARIKGQKDGAWRCSHCLGEFWDKTESTTPDKSNPMEGVMELKSKSDFTPQCIRCQLPMMLFRDNAWYCEQCEGQFWGDSAPEFNKIKDQLIKSTTKDIMMPDGGFKMVMSAKKKSSGRRSGKRRQKKPALRKSYYFPDETNRGA